jgi:hypothetical protein
MPALVAPSVQVVHIDVDPFSKEGHEALAALAEIDAKLS